MKLADWLKLPNEDGTKKRRSAFARQIGVTPQAITGYCDGTFWPRKEIAKKIYDETGGLVTPTDFMQTEPREAA